MLRSEKRRQVISKYLRAGAKTLAAPVLAMNQHRVERHFRLTLTDTALASKWVNDYLGGLKLAANAHILDFGCGRGRVTALLRQQRFRIAALDIQTHAWWQNLPGVEFRIAPPDSRVAPFGDAEFDVVLNIDSTHYYSAEQLRNHAIEVHRLLRPGGHWIVLQVNPEAYGASLIRLRPPGRMHSLEEVRVICTETGFNETDYWYEGLTSPCFPLLYARLRHLVAPYPLYMYDHGSWIERLVPARRRHRWVTRMQKAG